MNYSQLTGAMLRLEPLLVVDEQDDAIEPLTASKNGGRTV